MSCLFARSLRFAATALSCGVALVSAATGPAAIADESLDYTINWQSGLSLGEAHWRAHNSGTAQTPVWNFGLDLDAHVPGYFLTDAYRSTASAAYCTESFTRDQQHGSRQRGDVVTVDSQTLIATRKASNGSGESTSTVPACVHDALSFLFFARRELLSGRIPPPQTILFGGHYDVKLTSLGPEKVRVGDRNYETDKYGVNVRGPASNVNAEIFFARDAVRTPVLVRIPLTLGTFSVELGH